MNGRLSPAELHELRRGDSPVLLDVRGHNEAEGGRVPGGIVLPRRDVELRGPFLVPDRTHPVVCYDDGRPVVGGRTRADLAVESLLRQGFQRVWSLAGGVPAWIQDGHAVESGVNIRSKRFGEQVSAEDDVTMVSADELVRWQQDRDDVLLVDIRPPAEHARGCIPGAINVTGIDLARYAGVLAASGGTVVTHCAGRTRGIIAAQTLRLLGVPRVLTLENGTQGWMLSGHALEQNPPHRPTPERTPLPEEVLRRLPRVRTVDPMEVDAAGFAHVFDVRAPGEYRAGHAVPAVSAPGTQLIQATDEHVGVPTARIAVLDAGGDDPRAQLTGYWLDRMGYNVVVIAGGQQAWSAAGLPVATGPGAAIDGSTLELPFLSRAARSHGAVLDVDASTDYDRGHLAGSAWVSRDWLEADAAALTDAQRGATLVCRHPGAVHARLAAAALLAAGWTELSWLPLGDVADLTTDQPTYARPPMDVRLAPHEQGRQAMLDYLDWEISLHG